MRNLQNEFVSGTSRILSVCKSHSKACHRGFASSRMVRMYESIIEAMKAIAQNSTEELRQLKLTIPASLVVFDNLNISRQSQRYQQFHNQSRMLNYTIVYVTYNPETRLRRYLIRSDVDISKIQKIISADIVPTPQMKQIWAQTARVSFNQTMLRYCGPTMK